MNDILSTLSGIMLILICLVGVIALLLFIAGVTKKDLQESNNPVIIDKVDKVDKVEEEPVPLAPSEYPIPKTRAKKILVGTPVDKSAEVVVKPKRVYKKKPKE